MDLIKRHVNFFPKLPKGVFGFSIFTIFLICGFLALPAIALEPGSEKFIFAIGFLAFWRYSWGLTHFIRSIVYRKRVFPRWRKMVNENTESLMPSQIYLLITSYKIDSAITARVVRSAIEEAIACGRKCTIVASVVEMADEFLYRQLFGAYNPPEHVKLRIVRIPGTGKRDGLAHGFRAISRDMPPEDAVVAVIDGDTALEPGVLNRCTPFFKLNPKLGALTTDETPEVSGSATMKEWYKMRFAQRQILMCSLALSRRVMTLTGRMSMYRADIVTHPAFIEHMTNDHLDHWRLGRFKFLTGDDKSSLYWVLRQGYEQIYLPDVTVTAMESPPSPNFIKASTQLMFRWFGNMLRTNERILKLGVGKMPLFTWWCFLDQRISMWTSLAGPVFAIMLSLQYSWVIFLYYLVWVAFVRWVMTLMLLSARNEINWRYPFLLYYGQIYGSLIKTFVMFRLDRQSWTRQKTQLDRGLSDTQARFMDFSSCGMNATALILFIVAIGLITKTLSVPETTLRLIFG